MSSKETPKEGKRPISPHLKPKPFTKGDPRASIRTKIKEMKQKDLKGMLETELNKSINGVTRMEGLVARLVSEGIRGNMRAIELILAYMYGKPQNAVPQNTDKPFVLELTDGEDKPMLGASPIQEAEEVEEEESDEANEETD